MAGAGEKLEFGAKFLGELFGGGTRNQTVMVTGDEQDVLGKLELGDGMLGGETRGGGEIGALGRMRMTASMGEIKDMVEVSAAVGAVQVAGSDEIGEAGGEIGGEGGEAGEKAAGADGDG